jgi:GDSL-like Lipase/Acylhydrolase family
MRSQGAFRALSAAVVGSTLALTSIAAAQPMVLGVIGDSLSDEYFEETYSYAKNWSVQLVQSRGVNMGQTAQAAGRPGNSWGEPRRTGYEYVWARYGADSASSISDGQHTGLAAQVSPTGVTHAVVAIGANDFSPTTSVYFNIYFGLWSSTQTTNYSNTKVSEIRTITTTLRGAGANVVLANVVDFGLAPAARSVYGTASRRQRVADAVAQVNRGLATVARHQRVMLVDLSGLAYTILGQHSSPRQFLNIAGQSIQLLNRDTAAHANPLAGFVDDGAHPHTAVQGVFANVLMTALNQGWNLGLAPFSETEILTTAGLSPLGPDALPPQIGSLSQYVFDFRCPANFNGVSGVTVQDIFDFLSAYFSGAADADINLDSAVSVQDIFDFLSRWFAGC